MAYVRGESKNVIVGAAALFVNTLGTIPYLGKEEEEARKGVQSEEEAQLISLKKLPQPEPGKSYKETLSCPQVTEDNDYYGYGDCDTDGSGTNFIAGGVVRDNPYRNLGYTSDGLELTFEPDFGEIEVDQVLDSVKLFKQGMKVMLKTTLAEATLENLLVAIAGYDQDLWKYADEDEDGVASDGEMDPHPRGGRPDNLKDTWDDATGSLDLSSGQLGECPVERGLVAVGPGIGECGETEERIYIAYRALSIDNVTLSIKRDEETKFEVTFRLLPDDATGSYGKIVDRDWRAGDASGADGTV